MTFFHATQELRMVRHWPEYAELPNDLATRFTDRLLALAQSEDPSQLKVLKAARINDWTMLMWAACAGHRQLVELLLQAGLNSGNYEYGETALSLAIQKRHWAVVNLLLELPQAWNRRGIDKLVAEAVRAKNEKLVRKLVGLGLPITGDALLHSVQSFRGLRFFSLLMELGADPHTTIVSRPAISWMAGASPPAAVALLQAGADPNAGRDHPHNLPIFAAVNCNHAGLLNELIERGADIHLFSGIGSCTPLMNAALFGFPEMVKILLTAGADVNAYDAGGETAVQLAERGHRPAERARIVRILKAAGGKPAALPAKCPEGTQVNGRDRRFRSVLAELREEIRAGTIRSHEGKADHELIGKFTTDLADNDSNWKKFRRLILDLSVACRNYPGLEQFPRGIVSLHTAAPPPTEIPYTFGARMAAERKRAAGIFQQFTQRATRLGCLLFSRDQYLCLVPTTDKYELMRAYMVGESCTGPSDQFWWGNVCSFFKELEESSSWTLTHCGTETMAGYFSEKPEMTKKQKNMFFHMMQYCRECYGAANHHRTWNKDWKCNMCRQPLDKTLCQDWEERNEFLIEFERV